MKKDITKIKIKKKNLIKKLTNSKNPFYNYDLSTCPIIIINDCLYLILTVSIYDGY